MAASRKLLAEIQQNLKKVEEGVELFDEIWEKVYAAEQQSLKEKYEADLKKEIKKLQRLRDQIKTWISSSDIKDKNQLLEARKTIETKMEQFKICEKDTKIKAYSKEGLARPEKLDPREVLKEEKKTWINDCLDELNGFVESLEADKEKLLTAKSKSKSKDQIEKLDKRIQKHKWHIARLEQIVRMLDNDSLEPEQFDDNIMESLKYYLETAPDDDGALGVEHEFDIYEDLELETVVNVPSVSVETTKVRSASVPDVDEAVVPEVVNNSVNPPSVEPRNVDIVSTTSQEIIQKETKSAAKKNVSLSPAAKPSQKSSVNTDAQKENDSRKADKNTSDADASRNLNIGVSNIDEVEEVDQPVSWAHATASNSSKRPLEVPNAAPLTKESILDQSVKASSYPHQLQERLTPELMTILGPLKSSFLNSPDALEIERSSSYAPRNFYGLGHSTFPTAPLYGSRNENIALFDRLPLDSLFLAFYYQQGAYQQVLAAKQLKKHSWRFHKKYTTWFQRYEEPNSTMEDYEEGTYVYFDYESGWCQRIKSQFKFEYVYLEDELSNDL